MWVCVHACVCCAHFLELDQGNYGEDLVRRMSNILKPVQPPSNLSPEGFGVCTLKQSVFFFFHLAGRGDTFPYHSSLHTYRPPPPTCNTSSELWHFPTGGGEKIEPQSRRPAINHLSNYNRCKSFGCKKKKEREKKKKRSL